jgi:hypothetical protein
MKPRHHRHGLHAAARARHLTVVPLCPFVSGYIRRHPQYLPLVDPAHRARLQSAGTP